MSRIEIEIFRRTAGDDSEPAVSCGKGMGVEWVDFLA